MAYKVSFGSYQHSGSLQATVDITGSTTVSGAVGNFGTLTVSSFSPANISSTNITASSNMSASTANFGTLTVGTFSPANISTTTLTVTGVTTLSGNVALGDAPADVITVNGQITGSLFAINGGAINDTSIGATTQSSGKFTTLSASSTLDVGGTTTVQALSSSVGVSASVGQFGTLTAASFSPTNLTISGNLIVSGNTVLGDNSTDTLSVQARIQTNLIPTGTVDLGSVTNLWTNIYASSISASSTLQAAGLASLNGGVNSTNISGSGALQAGGIATIGNGLVVTTGGATITGTVAVSGGITTTNGITVSNGGMSVTGGVQLSAGLTVNGSFTVNGPVITLGDASSDVVTVNAQITGAFFAINGGAINGTTIGASTQSSAKFTTISSSGDVIVGGNLTVQGTTTTVNSTTLEIKDKNIVIASGSTTSLLANGSGLTLGSTGYEFNFQSSSAGTSTDFFQVSGTAGLTDFKAKTVFATVDGNVTQQTTNLGDANGTLSVGINYSQADFTAPRTWTLPASPSVGQSVKVKAPHNCDVTNTLTVSAGAKAIDFTGNTTVVLASPDAALELVYVDSANNLWKIF